MLSDGSWAVNQPQKHTMVFVLVPKFSMIAFVTALEPLRLANRFLKRKVYDWRVVSLDGRPVSASNGVSIIPDGSLQDLRANRLDIDKPDYYVVCSGIDVEKISDTDFFNWLRRAQRENAILAGLCTAAWLFAKAGIMENRRCAIHWETLPTFCETFQEVEAHADLYETDGNIMTCAGGTAPLDMMLDVIGRDHGPTVVTWVCEQSLKDKVRGSNDRQRASLRVRYGVHNGKLLQLIDRMEANISEPLSLADLADHAGLSVRHVERLFRQHLGRSPARYYLDLRLDRARHLLFQSNMSVVEVAVACGFVSASHFSKCYRELFGRSPQADRHANAMEEVEAGAGI